MGVSYIQVRVKPRAREERVKKLEEKIFSVWVKEPAEKGRANAAVVKVLEEYFKDKVGVEIINGHTSRIKLVKIIN